MSVTVKATVKVLSVPAAHPYPMSLRSNASPDSPPPVEYLSDPPGRSGDEGRWWPPPALDVSWVEQHADEVDVVHLHFGFDAHSPDDLARWVRALRRHGVRFVLTVHDVVNPHFHDQALHLDRLDVLVPAADRVLTLTPGAAADIRARWGVDPTVVPHPHVVPLHLVGRPRPPRTADEPFVVGLHLKSLRANVAAGALLPGLVDAVGLLPDGHLRVNLHREVLDPRHPRHDSDLVETLIDLDRTGTLELHVHDPLDDDELWAWLGSIDLSVLPYAFGTHSGWVEACHDLGTAVLAPRTGHWVEQQPMLTYGWHETTGPVHDDVVRAVRHAHDSPPVPASRELRAAQQHEIARRHADLYAAVLAGRSTDPSTGDVVAKGVS